VTGNPPKKLIIKSNTSELTNVEEFVNQLFEECCIPHKYFNKVFLCVSEAVVNSIEHGNKNDANKEISIFADCALESVYVKISDEGAGFNLDEVIDPTIQENIKKESGRGLYIIKSLSEQIEYNRTENSIQFKIKCK